MRRLGVLLMAMALGLTTACESQRSAPLAPTRADEDTAYRLGPGDKLRVIVFGETNLTGEFAVDGAGLVALPLLGAVKASGLTAPQFSSVITRQLADGYIKDPRVSVEVLTYRPFYILGEVAKPGEYPFQSGLTLLDAIATAGGFTYRANTRRLFVKKPDEADERRVNLTAGMLVQPGETIRVPERLF